MYTVLLVLSALTMIVGLVGALTQRDLRRVLSFNLVGHIGFTTVGLALGTPSALGGSILYMLHHMLVITTLFLVSGLFLRQRRTSDLAALGGFARQQPAVAALVMIPVFSLAGVPPLSGFVAKLAVITGILERQHFALAGLALAVGLLTLLSMARLWDEAIWKPSPGPEAPRLPSLGPAIVAPIAVLSVLIVVFSAAAGPVFALAARAASELLDPDAYVRAVLGG